MARAAHATALADADRESEPASRVSSVASLPQGGAPLRFGGSTMGDGGELEYELTDDEDFDAPSSRSSQDGCARRSPPFMVHVMFLVQHS